MFSEFHFVSAQPSATVTSERKGLKILSWNIYMLPRFARPSGKRRRAHAIVNELKKDNYDIIVFQEAFLAASRRIIRKGLKTEYPHRLGPANKHGISYKTSSGVWMLSKIPLKQLGEVDFSLCEGADCWARKGALLAEGEWEGIPFQILGTHIEAGGPDSIHFSQFNEIEELLMYYNTDGVPQLICGDLNTRQTPGEGMYPVMINTFQCMDGEFEAGKFQFTADGIQNDMNHGGPKNLKIIDYVLYRANGLAYSKIRRCIPEIRNQWHKDHKDLSDHFPVSAEIWWKVD